MSTRQPVFIGYFPKKTVLRPIDLNAPNVIEICSVSNCISEAPPNWLEFWLHNDFFLFNSLDDAREIIKSLSDKHNFRIYAFRQYPISCENGTVVEIALSPIKFSPAIEQFDFLGYDAVCKDEGEYFGCSPLSCNNGAEVIKTNKYCLFDTYEEAIFSAKKFSKEKKWEPGIYYVVEVYREKPI